MSLWVKVDEDVFPITMAEETPAPDEMIGEKRDTRDNDEVELEKSERDESSRDLLCEIDRGEKSIKHHFEMVKKAHNRGAFSAGDSNPTLFGPERRQYVGSPSKAQAQDYSRIENTSGPKNS
ncbi:hypothetical protein Ancab_022966 [Ancistrocladus abbreviatus]